MRPSKPSTSWRHRGSSCWASLVILKASLTTGSSPSAETSRWVYRTWVLNECTSSVKDRNPSVHSETNGSWVVEPLLQTSSSHCSLVSWWLASAVLTGLRMTGFRGVRVIHDYRLLMFMKVKWSNSLGSCNLDSHHALYVSTVFVLKCALLY